MVKIKIGDTMELTKVLNEGVSGNTVQSIVSNNVEKPMTRQAANVYKMYSDIASGVGENFIESFRKALTDGLKPEDLRKYFGTLLLSPISMEEINFKMRVILETKIYEEKMKLKNQEIQNQPQFQVVEGGMQKVYVDQNNRAA